MSHLTNHFKSKSFSKAPIFVFLFSPLNRKMAAKETFFERNDSHHGLAKRIILHRYLQGEFARGFRREWRTTNQEEYNTREYDMTYFDAFAGAGRYQKSDKVEEIQYVEDEKRTCPFEEESYGSPLVALHALYQHITEQKGYGTKKVLLVFVERDGANFQHLKQHVKNFISKLGKYEIRKENTITWNVPLSIQRNNITVVIKFFHCSFKDFDDDLLISNQPMVSFFDPFGYSHTPMEKVKKYAGIRRTVILNLMVSSMHRFVLTKRNQKNFEDLFGSSQWREHLPNDFDGLLVPQKMKSYSSIYQTLFKEADQREHSPRLPVDFIEFSIRKGSKQSVDRGFIYYLLFAAIDLRSLANVKCACHVVAQNFKLLSKGETSSNELFFCDYYFDSAIPWRPKSSKEEEAMYIYDHFKGITQTFGRVKEWIILKSPYQVHSRSFKYLEDEGYLDVVSFDYDREEGVAEYKRPRSGVFPSNVGIKHNTPDWDKRLHNPIRYCNGWELKFHEVKQERKNRRKRKQLATETPAKDSNNATGGNETGKVKRKLDFKM